MVEIKRRFMEADENCHLLVTIAYTSGGTDQYAAIKRVEKMDDFFLIEAERGWTLVRAEQVERIEAIKW